MSETIAHRVKRHEAKRHFDDGGSVLVSERGHELTVSVSASITTHDSSTITWNELTTSVKMWRNRYPNQRFYIIAGDGTGPTT